MYGKVLRPTGTWSARGEKKAEGGGAAGKETAGEPSERTVRHVG